MMFGDVVKRKDKEGLMTIEYMETRLGVTYVHCIWFDTNDKLRKLRFYPDDLVVVSHASAGNLGLK